MGDEQRLLDAIVAAPDDDVPRMVYADWLQSRGDPRGELIQLQCQLAAVPDDDRRRNIRIAENKLLAAHGQAWKQPLLDRLPPGFEYKLEFVRGFIEEATIPLACLSHLEVVLALAPLLRKLKVTTSFDAHAMRIAQPRLAGVLDQPGFSQLRALELALPGGGNAIAHEVAAATTLRGLRALVIRASVWGDQVTFYAAPADKLRLDDDGAAALAGSPNLGAVEHLTIEGNRIGPAGLVAIAHGTWRLRELQAGYNFGAERGLARSLVGPALATLETLGLEGTPLDPDDAVALAGGACSPVLRELLVEKCQLGAPGTIALCDAMRVPMRRLRLDRNSLGDAGATAVAGCAGLAGLTSLELGHNRIGQKGAAALAKSPHLASLERLTLNEPKWKPETAALFAASPTLANTRIYLAGKLLARGKKPK